MKSDYTVEPLSATIDAETLTRRYRDVPRFMELCRKCSGFGKSWLCPPVSVSPGGYATARIEAVKIIPAEGCTLSGAEIMQDARGEFERQLLKLESQTGGMACGLSGDCPYCGKLPCSRTEGKPCRHPRLARPSLEALGFNVAAIAAEVLATPIKWETDGCRPPYYMLVGAVFYCLYSGS